jgi:hypothetical protein
MNMTGYTDKLQEPDPSKHQQRGKKKRLYRGHTDLLPKLGNGIVINNGFL